MHTIDKSTLQQTLLALEDAEIEQARRKGDQSIRGAMIDGSEPDDRQNQADAVTSAVQAEQWDAQLQEHLADRTRLEQIDFAPTDTVGSGAIVCVGGRWLVVSVPTPSFEYAGHQMLGVSTEAPLVVAMLGLSAGDAFTWEGRKHVVEAVF